MEQKPLGIFQIVIGGIALLSFLFVLRMGMGVGFTTLPLLFGMYAILTGVYNVGQVK